MATLAAIDLTLHTVRPFNDKLQKMRCFQTSMGNSVDFNEIDKTKVTRSYFIPEAARGRMNSTILSSIFNAKHSEKDSPSITSMRQTGSHDESKSSSGKSDVKVTMYNFGAPSK